MTQRVTSAGAAHWQSRSESRHGSARGPGPAGAVSRVPEFLFESGGCRQTPPGLGSETSSWSPSLATRTVRVIAEAPGTTLIVTQTFMPTPHACSQ